MSYYIHISTAADNSCNSAKEASLSWFCKRQGFRIILYYVAVSGQYVTQRDSQRSSGVGGEKEAGVGVGEGGREGREVERRPPVFPERGGSEKKKMSSFRPWHFDKKRLSAKLQTTGWGKHSFTSQMRKRRKKREKKKRVEGT